MSARPAVFGLAAAGLALAAGLQSGCAIGALRSDEAAQAAAAVPARVSASAVARAVDVTGRRGRLSAAQREALIQRIGAQGGANQLNRHLLAMASFDEVDLFAHNQTTLLIDGPSTFAAMFAAIEQARQSVLLQSYIIEDAAISQRLAELLARKRAQGVAVAVLYDDLGSIGTPRQFLQALQAAGVPTCAFNPVSPFKRPGYWGISHRDHRKILTVDRGTGFTGGINISAVYASGSFGRARLRTASDAQRSGWRDTQVRLQGPAVAALEDVMRKTWADQGCRTPLPAPASAPALAPAAADVVRIVPSGPDDADSRIYAMLLNAIDTASRSVQLTMAYFAPGQEMVDALCDAARRGVDVRLILPSISDFAPVLHAGRSHYQRLLEAGVRLYELDDAVLHAKTAVIDGVVSTVGSSNMDWRSFVANNEVNAVVFGENFGSAMDTVFQNDLRRSTEITPALWAQRPLAQRAKESLARLFERLW
ncbi:phospholipase D-like domain-containing protein [Aquabacterium sp. OR-4]|uniref:phospholipase D-like domain-containing protein n=1 Tax=Aquabacterium sp. OR-4 TaxID=2978127 RepID=UPI0028C83CBE|nr:phospholipase D-like domain-containing protein [Aquabacterium sp. OR-4]MDT7835028.1 phospholipase D-like domain-containing protein [Aquabacterium sp. OR-4]